MANATTMVGFWSALVDSSGASQNMALDPDKMYAIRHYGKDSGGAADVNEVKIEFSKKNGSAADAAAAVRTADTDNIIIKADDVIYTRRGMVEFNYIRFGGAPQLEVFEVVRDFYSN